MYRIGLALTLIAVLQSCTSKKSSENTLFSLLSPQQTGIQFSNDLQHTEDFNAYIYKNFYNGAGVAIGDINNDGLADIYFCGNQKDNKLYLNKGNFQFEDITEKAGVACKNVWSSGVSFADVNGDGLLDIYVCKSGSPEGENRNNELFINNGDLTFTEKAAEYKINDLGLSTHAIFFDYDKDGDLDCYLLNNSIRTVGGYDLIKDQREIRDTLGGNKLYRNEEGKYFTDVSEAAGIYGSDIGFGLGVSIGDINRDGWQDIFVSNDFFERDYLYLNNQDGTFTEALEDHIREISMGSMGADVADINNDGYPEIYVTDMLPRDDARLKTTMTFDDWDKHQRMVETGYYQQFTRNVLQLNSGKIPSISDSTPVVRFDEIGRFSDVHATDWSWGALILDMDNDGWKDIFVANGIYKDLLDQDYINFFANPYAIASQIKKGENAITQLIDAIPSNPLPNYAFHNNKDLTFTNKALEWGFEQPTFSNGSAYGDLDNDGDLDLVVNNVNMPAFIYQNNTNTQLQDRRFLQFNLKGKGKNPFAVGTQITIRHKGKSYYQELAPMRGFQSSVDYRLHFGLDTFKIVDSVIVRWMDDRYTILTNVETNQTFTLQQSDAVITDFNLFATKTHFQQPIFSPPQSLDFLHQEQPYVDFNRERLLYHMRSAEGPKIAKGDVNGDGKMDFYVGGAKDQAGQLFLQTATGFQVKNIPAFEKDKACEDSDAVFFDADGDGDLDLYVAGGTSELSSASLGLKDRLYFNDGKGNFLGNDIIFPNGKYEYTSCVKPNDFDGDGDMDLFVGIRMNTFLYGVPAHGYLLENDGKGNFKNVTKTKAPQLNEIGLITDAVWVDVNGDNADDLVIVGEWLPITVFENQKGQFKIKKENGLAASNGWWNCIQAADLDGDGAMDFVVGNHGINTRFKVTEQFPMCLYVNDFDKNGTAEQILCAVNGDTLYPFVLRHDLVKQIPPLKKKYLKYESYKNQTIHDIFTKDQLKNSVILTANVMQSVVILNKGKGQFDLKPLPLQAQMAPMYGIVIEDFDEDGSLDILMAGNFYRAKPEVGRYDGSHGVFLKGNGKGDFVAVEAAETGLFIRGEVRDLEQISTPKGNHIIIARNNDFLQLLNYSTNRNLN